MNFIAINEAIGTNILSSYRNLLEIKTIKKNKKKGLTKLQKLLVLVFEAINEVKEQEKFLLNIENSRLEFYSHKPSKRTRSKCLINAQKPVLLALKSETK